MTKEPFFRLNQEPDALSGFSRTVAEIQWLLLVLMMFYLVVGQIEENVKIFLLGGLCAFAGFVMIFHYLNFFCQSQRLETGFRNLGHDLVGHLVRLAHRTPEQPVT